jgi:hypothetical protein
MQLAEVIGQSAISRLIARLIAADRLPHAVLLEGLPGCGRRTLATAIAQAVLCHAPQAGDSCGVCASCRLVLSGSHPDLVSTPHDSIAGNVGVELVRDEIVDAAYVSPLVGTHRVFVLPGIERWRVEASNTLLKVLEEPPATVRFILTTTQAAAVMRTIRSRSQLYRLQTLTPAAVEQVLVRGGIAVGEARKRALLSDGGHRGLWEDTVAIPLQPLLALARDGYRTSVVAEIIGHLPTVVSAQAEAQGLTLAAEQRRLVRIWLAALTQALRADLRLDAASAQQAAERIVRIGALAGDLARNLQPRLVLESIGLGETERRLRRSGL